MRKTEYTENGGFLQRDSVEHEEYAEAYSTENQEIRERDGANLLEKVLDRNNLNKAYKRVKANKGASGVDGMRDCGDHHFEYSIKAYEKGFDKNNAVLDGVAYNAQFQVVNGELNIESLPTLICDDTRISSIKMSQDKKGIIIRINEYHGKDTKGTLIIPENIKAKAVYVTDLKEDIIKALPFSDGKVPLEMAHYEIKTIYIEL